MALILVEGFDHFATPDLTKKGWNSGATILQSGGRRGGGAAFIPSASYPLQKTLPTPITGSAYCGVAMYLGGAYSSGGLFMQFLSSGGGAQINLQITSTGAIQAYRGGTLLGTSTATLPLGGWFYLEVGCTLNSSAGVVTVQLNGTVILSLTGQNTLYDTTNQNIAALYFNAPGYGAMQVTVDDLYVCDGTGSSNNTFLGDCRVDTLYPNGDGNYTQLPAFPSSAVLSSTHSYWRLCFDSNTSSSLTIFEVSMAATVGGSNQCTGGTASGNNINAGPPSVAFDGNTSTYVQFGVVPSYLQYQFASPVSVVEVTLNYSFYIGNNSPTQIRLQYSDDGVTFTDIAQWNPLPATTAINTFDVPTSTTRWGNVADVGRIVPANGVSGSTTGNKDTFAFQDLPTVTGSIYGVQVTSVAQKDDAGSRQMKTVCRSGGADYLGNAVSVGTSPLAYSTLYPTDPNTSAAWTQSGFNAAEFGVEVD